MDETDGDRFFGNENRGGGGTDVDAAEDYNSDIHVSGEIHVDQRNKGIQLGLQEVRGFQIQIIS